MRAHDAAIQLAAEFKGRDLNEADTRHRIIDPLITDVFGWPRNRVRCEEYIKPGFADYVLERGDGGKILLLEAKREGTYFDLPHSLIEPGQGSYVRMKTLLTDPAINSAVNQVRNYCLDVIW